MADICVSYIVVIRNKNDIDGFVERVIMDYLNKGGFVLKDGCFHVDEDKIYYEISHKSRSNRVYIKLFTSMRFDKGVKSIEKLDDSLFRSDFKKYADIMRGEDGASALLSEKLYPKYAQYERSLRHLVLLVLTKAFGGDWIYKTLSEDKLDEIKKRSKGGNVSLTEVLELFDLKQLEGYLFDKREVDYLNYINNQLYDTNLDKMSKDEICRVIDNMRPKSLWEKHFQDIGDEKKWKEQLESIHNCRNKVAHHRRITYEEYIETNHRLKIINKQISDAVSIIQNRDFSNIKSIDLLGGFALLVNSVKELFSKYVFSGLISEINNAIQQKTEPIVESFINAIDAYRHAGRIIADKTQPLIEKINLEQMKIMSHMNQNMNNEIIKKKKLEFEAMEMAERINVIAKDSNE